MDPRLNLFGAISQPPNEQIRICSVRLGYVSTEQTPSEGEGIWRGIWLEEAHHSTAIEGNTLVLDQVERLLTEGRAVGNKELSEYLEVRGYADAANWVYEHGIRPGEWDGGELISRYRRGT